MELKEQKFGIEIEMTEEDLALLKEHTVDFISFSVNHSNLGCSPASKETSFLTTPSNILACGTV